MVVDKRVYSRLTVLAAALQLIACSTRPVASLQSSQTPAHSAARSTTHSGRQSSGVSSHLYLQNPNKNDEEESSPADPIGVTSTTTDHILKLADELDAESSALLDELREEMGSDSISIITTSNGKLPIVEPPVMFAAEDETTQSFDLARWDNHRSAGRYFRLMPGVLFSVTTRRIAGTVGFLVFWSSIVQQYNTFARVQDNLPALQLPIVPFELTAPVLGLLLVFRSDRAFDRFSLGSEACWEITNHCRTICRELLAFTAKERFAEEERRAAYELVDAIQILHGLIMKRYLRGKQCIVSPRQAEKFFQKALGVESSAANSSLVQNTTTKKMGTKRTTTQQQQPLLPLAPSAAMAAISLGISKRLPSLDFQESTLMEGQMGELQISLGSCEKLLRTPIPLGYTRYSVRFLWAWLYLLPFALVDTFYEFGLKYPWWQEKPQPVLVFAMLFICFTFISIEDISVQIEEPFSTLPLGFHHKWLERDVGQMVTMNKAVDATTATTMERTKEEKTPMAAPAPAPETTQLSSHHQESQREKDDTVPIQEDDRQENGLHPVAALDDEDDEGSIQSPTTSSESPWRERRRSLKKKILGKITVSTR